MSYHVLVCDIYWLHFFLFGKMSIKPKGWKSVSHYMYWMWKEHGSKLTKRHVTTRFSAWFFMWTVSSMCVRELWHKGGTMLLLYMKWESIKVVLKLSGTSKSWHTRAEIEHAGATILGNWLVQASRCPRRMWLSRRTSGLPRLAPLLSNRGDINNGQYMDRSF